VGWVDLELALVAVAAMLSPTTLSFSVLTLVLSDRPLRSGFWFYLGALGTTLCIGIIAAFVLGDAAASANPSSPKPAVAILDLVAGTVLLLWIGRLLRRPRDPRRAESMLETMRKVSTSSTIAIVGAGATLANPGGFIPLALKEISELDPTPAEYVVEWTLFALVSLLPLALALILLVVAPGWTKGMLNASQSWLELHVRTIAAVILIFVAATLIRNGIAGLAA
jgi:Sap, sulfolipid-1-addressing protein